MTEIYGVSRVALSPLALQQILGIEPEQLDMRADPRPAVLQEMVTLGEPELLRCPRQHEHADAATDLHIAVVLEALIGLGDRQRIGAMLGGKRANRGKLVPRTILAAQDR